MADVFLYLLRLASVLDADLNAAAQAKIERNERRRPVEPFRGSATKRNRRK